MEQPELPNKLYFRIGEVARIVGVKPYVLRYWETEFPILKPGKTPSRHRLYRQRDVELLLEIKHLLYEEGFTIAGAKKQLKDGENPSASSAQSAQAPPQDSSRSSPSPVSNDPTPAPQLAPTTDQHQLLRTIRADIDALYKMLAQKPA